MTAQAITLPKLTIVTVVYNAINSLERTILSVIEQEYPNIEYLIIDGGSNDGSVDLIKKYQEKITYWCSERDQGIYDAMNKGLKRSTGDWICFLNADDCFVNSQVLGKIAMELKDSEVNYYSRAIIEHNGKELYVYPKDMPDAEWVGKYYPVHQTVFMSQQYKNVLFDLSYKIHADSYQMRCLNKISEFMFIDIISVRFSLGGVSSQFKSLSDTLFYMREMNRFLYSINEPLIKRIYPLTVCVFKFILSNLLTEKKYYKVIGFIRNIRE